MNYQNNLKSNLLSSKKTKDKKWKNKKHCIFLEPFFEKKYTSQKCEELCCLNLVFLGVLVR